MVDGRIGHWVRFVVLISAGFTTAAVMSAPAADAVARNCFGREATIVGTVHADEIQGTSEIDVIVGLGGDDVIEGLGANDTICGNAGDDILIGGVGRENLVGGGGNDSLIGNEAGDDLWGGPGDDELDGGGSAFDSASFLGNSAVHANLETGMAQLSSGGRHPFGRYPCSSQGWRP